MLFSTAGALAMNTNRNVTAPRWPLRQLRMLFICTI